jgi:hypothetical protein
MTVHWLDLTDDELEQAPANVKATIEALTRRIDATGAAAVGRGWHSREQAQAEASEAVERWARVNITGHDMHDVLLYLACVEVVRQEGPR